MKKYELSKEYKFLIALFLLVITTLSIPPYHDYQSAIVLFFCIIIWYQVFRIPYMVIISETNYITFKSLWKTTIINPADVKKIEDSVFSYKIIHKSGNMKISTLINDSYGLKRHIESINRNIIREDVDLKHIEEAERQDPLIRFGIILTFLILSIVIRFFLYTAN